MRSWSDSSGENVLGLWYERSCRCYELSFGLGVERLGDLGLEKLCGGEGRQEISFQTLIYAMAVILYGIVSFWRHNAGIEEQEF